MNEYIFHLKIRSAGRVRGRDRSQREIKRGGE
jgi:hypothetical protein